MSPFSQIREASTEAADGPDRVWAAHCSDCRDSVELLKSSSVHSFNSRSVKSSRIALDDRLLQSGHSCVCVSVQHLCRHSLQKLWLHDRTKGSLKTSLQIGQVRSSSGCESISFIPRCVQMVTAWKPPFPAANTVIKPKSSRCEPVWCHTDCSLKSLQSTLTSSPNSAWRQSAVAKRETPRSTCDTNTCTDRDLVHRKAQSCISLFSRY